MTRACSIKKQSTNKLIHQFNILHHVVGISVGGNSGVYLYPYCQEEERQCTHRISSCVEVDCWIVGENQPWRGINQAKKQL
jgi:hypothetical protein